METAESMMGWCQQCQPQQWGISSSKMLPIQKGYDQVGTLPCGLRLISVVQLLAESLALGLQALQGSVQRAADGLVQLGKAILLLHPNPTTSHMPRSGSAS